MFRRTLYSVLLVLVAVTSTAQDVVSAYEYWLDSDYDSRTSSDLPSGEELSLSVDISNLCPGLHFLNFRAKDIDSLQWGGVSRFGFMVTTRETATIARYESWLDSDYEHRTLTEQTGDSLTQVIDISGLEEGVHCYNFRAQNVDGVWGPLHRYIVFIAEPDAAAQVASVNYWIDEPTDTICQYTRGTSVHVTVDISQLETGTHTFSCYLQNVLGDTTDVYHWDFEVGYVNTPVITHTGNTIHISCSTPNAQIRYTLNDSIPREADSLYTKPFVVTQNGIIKARAMREGFIHSEVVKLNVNWFAEPQDKQPWEEVLAEVEGIDTIISTRLVETEQQVVNGEPWVATHRLRCDTLRAMLACCTLNEADKTSILLRKVEQVETLLPAIHTEYAAIVAERNTLQAILDSLTTLEAKLNRSLTAATLREEVSATSDSIARLREGYATLQQRQQQLTARTQAWAAQLTEVEQQVRAIENDIVESTLGITVAYALRNDQFQRLHRYPRLRYLNLRRSTIENDALRDSIFMGLPKMVCVELPETVISTGSGLFTDCPNLATVVWRSNEIVADRVFTGINNPNLLLYVNEHAQVRDVSIRNIVMGSVATSITLTDGDNPEQNTNFYVPYAFHVADEITYDHIYNQITGLGECRGWETIVLPFNVQHIEHERNGGAVPFLGYEAGKRPFWLCRLTEQGFEDADSIRACEPYIISMPNNEAYSPFYRINGGIHFSARDTDVPATTWPVAHRGNATFHPTFERVEASQEVFTLNVGEEAEGQNEGSAFIRGYGEVRPFQAYRTTTDAGVRMMLIADDLKAAQTGIEDVQRKLSEGRTYNLQGLPVTAPGRGVYIRNGQKLVKP